MNELVEELLFSIKELSRYVKYIVRNVNGRRIMHKKIHIMKENTN